MTLRSSAKISFIEKLTVKTLVHKSPYNRGVLLWNTLTEEQHHISTLKLLKKNNKKCKFSIDSGVYVHFTIIRTEVKHLWLKDQPDADLFYFISIKTISEGST